MPHDRRVTLSALIESRKLSISQFARDVVGRDERTVRRWLTGEVEIPQSVSQWLARLEAIEVTDDHVSITVRSRART